MLSSTSGWAVGNGGSILIMRPETTRPRARLNRKLLTAQPRAPVGHGFVDGSVDCRIGCHRGRAHRRNSTPDGSWSAYSSEVTTPAGSSLSVANGRYLQYRVTITRGTTPTETPELDDIEITYGKTVVTTIFGARPCFRKRHLGRRRLRKKFCATMERFGRKLLILARPPSKEST